MTGLAQRIDADWDHITARLRRQSSSAPSQESTMTTPQQRNIFADVASVLTEVAANPLMVRLARERLGELLTADDIDHIAGLVRSIEQRGSILTYDSAHPQAPQQRPQFTPHDDSAQFPADGQHQ